MTLKELLTGVVTQTPLTNATVAGLARDSRQVAGGDLFFAIDGAKIDGHSYSRQALDAGAAWVVVERDLGLERQIIVESTHKAYGLACGNFYGNPSRKLKLIGVTGTNGKTTVTYITKSILEQAGHKTGLIGTVENQIGDISLQARYTTPDPYELHALFARMVKAGCEYVVMEVSSHGLDQERLAGCHFAASGFTNLTQDHLDYHGTMEAYFQAKKKLFSISDFGVVNGKDSYGKRLTQEVEIPTTSFSSQGGEDLWAEDLQFSEKGAQFVVHYKEEAQRVSFPQPGLYSVENALCATGLCLGVGLTLAQIREGLCHTPGIPGRFEILPTQTNYTVVRDFAHSADGLHHLLSTVKSFATGRIVTLFGCAGERDRSKRKIMAETVAQYSDLCIMTADNPRSEPIEQILQDALPGFESYPTLYKVFTDRFEAVLWALMQSKEGDILLLAGKGHEDYQVLKEGSINFNEGELVLDLLKRIKAGETWT